MSKEKKKPVKLDFEVTLLEHDAPEQVKVEFDKRQTNTKRQIDGSTEPRAITGIVKVRREVKGRAGKPVTVLYDFSDQNATHSPSLKQLQAQLKVKLACGGTYLSDSGQILLQVDDLVRVKSVLEQLGFTVKG